MLFFCRVKLSSRTRLKESILILSSFLWFSFFNSRLLNSLLWSLFLSARLSQLVAASVGTAVKSTVNLLSEKRKKERRVRSSSPPWSVWRSNNISELFACTSSRRSAKLVPLLIQRPETWQVFWAGGLLATRPAELNQPAAQLASEDAKLNATFCDYTVKRDFHPAIYIFDKVYLFSQLFEKKIII